MRFRYFDSEGTEVGVSSVDALRFRIRKGVVTPETLLYDAAAGQWALARENPLFRFLVEEEEDLLPPEMRPLMEGEASSPGGDEPGSGRSGRPWKAGGRRVEFTNLDASLDVELPEGDGLDQDSAHLGAGSLSNKDEDSPDDGVLPSGTPSGDTLEDGFPDIELRIPETQWARDSDPEDDAPAAAAHAGRTSGPGPLSSTSRKTVAPKPGPRWIAQRKGRRERGGPLAGFARRRKRRRSLVAVTLVSVGAALVAGITIFLFGGVGGDDRGSAYALVGSVAQDLLSAEAGDASANAATGRVEARARSSGDGATRPGPAETVAAAPTTPDPETMERLADRVETAASKDLTRAMSEERVSTEVPESPPAIWLQGRYLAAADSFPEVKAYWQALSAYVSSLEDREDELYAGFVRRRAHQAGLDSTGTARLESRVLERRRAGVGDRGTVYRDLSELARHSVTLHELLAARSGDISYEPFDGTGLSRDPVIEAVAEDPVLGEEIWGRLDRILELLESLQGLRPVSTAQLQEALFRTPAAVDGTEKRTPDDGGGPPEGGLAPPPPGR